MLSAVMLILKTRMLALSRTRPKNTAKCVKAELLIYWGYETHPSCIVKDLLIWLSIIGGVSIWVISKLGQHWCNDWHVSQNIWRNLPHPFWQSFHVDWLDDLISGPLYPGENRQKKIETLLRDKSSDVVICKLLMHIPCTVLNRWDTYIYKTISKLS